MRKEIEQLIRNAQTYCQDRLVQVSGLSVDNMFEDDFLKAMIPALYNADLDDELKNLYSIDELKSDLIELFRKVKPTQAVAESYELETWLDSSRRVNPEIRFEAYKKLLISENKGAIIPQMDADTYKILDSCYNPSETSREWDRRGLVYGHVQSGKTANYIGLINRALDAGYKIVIVLTGMTEDLRRQTQYRIDEGVVGQREQVDIGVGLDVNFKVLDEIMPATSLKKDLKKNDDWRDNNLNTNKKSIWVIKKNKSVLENLILWLDKQRSDGNDSKIHNVPFLIIDDEADNASIQSLSKKDYEEWGEGKELAKLDHEELTEKQEKDLANAKARILKAINRNIRIALSLMSHKTFVAYTATPYSIINQTSEDLARTATIGGKVFNIEENSDLFPEHFIIPISAGSKYMGIERIFPNDKSKRLPVVVNVSTKYANENLDSNYFPTKRGQSYSFPNIPRSLEDAIIHFLISIIIRKHRKHSDYNSLLVHTSHLTDNADYLADKIEEFITKLQVNLPSNSGGYFNRIENTFKEIKKQSSNKLFKNYFDHDYAFPDSITKNEILDVINSRKDTNDEYLYAPFEVVSYHSSSKQDLKHKNHTLKFDLRDSETGDKKFKNYIVVGGNRLSRGLTLEGLTTTYFIRNSTRQDSLYQMGRWFGYRIGFEDLVRIYMPTDQIQWFNGVYKLEMDLRKDFEQNNEEDTKMLPRDAVIKLAYHTNENMHVPKELRKKFPAICDPNKLRNTRTQLMSFYGSKSTNRIINDIGIQKKNISLVKRILESVKLDSKAKLFDMSKSSVPDVCMNTNTNYTDVNCKYIIDLLDNYDAHDKLKSDLIALRGFIETNKDKINNWSLVLVNTNKGDSQIEGWTSDFYVKKELKSNVEISSLKRASVPEGASKETLYFKAILNRQKDNIFDIVDESNCEEYPPAKVEDGKPRQADIAKQFRNKSGKPMLLIYPVKTDIGIVPLLYFFIPKIKGADKVRYIVRKK
tara:strand:+ start:2569 stop:5514 length:2946 start_codon:yes stop_codon:yes gene_type:complete